MSLGINTTTPEGIVLAASRQSYRNRKGMARIGSDNASKLFQLNKRIGIFVTGLAFLPEDEVMKDLGQEEIRKQLGGLQYAIQWGTMTLQDAIDFCTLMIQTTSAIQRFSDGIIANPGDMPGVGGPVDVAVITADQSFIWVSRKKLKIEGKEIDLD